MLKPAKPKAQKNAKETLNTKAKTTIGSIVKQKRKKEDEDGDMRKHM